MTQEELEKVVAKLTEKYGDNIPSIEHEPITLRYLINIYLYDIRKEQLSSR